MKVLVTGGRGFIGSRLCHTLATTGYEVDSFDRRAPRGSEPGINHVLGDVTDPGSLRQAMQPADAVIHLAGMVGTEELFSKPVEAARTNILGLVQLLELAKNSDTKVVCVTKPLFQNNIYTACSVAVEAFCRAYSEIDSSIVTLVRLYNVFGPGQSLQPVRKLGPTVIAQALLDKDISIFGRGDSIVALQYVDDAVRSLTDAIDSKSQFVDTIDSVVFCTVTEFVNLVRKLTKSRSGTAHFAYRSGESKAKIGDFLTGKAFRLAKGPENELPQRVQATIEHYRSLPVGLLNDAIENFDLLDASRQLLTDVNSGKRHA